jgi:ferredoxin
MKQQLFAFSGTGNSLALARAIAGPLCAELSVVRRNTLPTEIHAESIGIVFPVYMLNAPLIVTELLNRIRSCNYLFIAMTMGGRSGTTVAKIRRQLARRNLRLDAAFSFQMPDNYIVWNGAEKSDKQQRLFVRAEAEVSQLVDKVEARAQFVSNERSFELDPAAVPLAFRFMPRWLAQSLCDMSLPMIPKMDRSFVVSDSCNACGICEKICPASNITISAGRPQWHHCCEQCLACLQWCPRSAIDHCTATRGRARYHHPAVKLKDLMGE